MNFFYTPYKLISTFIFLLALFASANGQEKVIIRDFEMWNNFSVKKKLSKKWDLGLSEELRFVENAGKLDVLFTELSLDYKINKRFEIGGEYRFYRNSKNNGSFEYQKRLRAKIYYNKKIKRFRLTYRLSFQNKNENVWLNETISDVSTYNFRNKISVDYDVKKNKLQPYLSTEIFRIYEQDIIPEFNKYRITVGANYPILKNTKLELFYRLDKELNTNYPKSISIFGTSLKYKF